MIMTNGHRLLVNVGTYKYIIIYCFKVKIDQCLDATHCVVSYNMYALSNLELQVK